MIKIRTLFVGLILTMMMSNVAIAQELEPLLLEHPNKERIAYYREHIAEILALREQIQDGEVSERLDALKQLSANYPDAVIQTAIALLEDSTVEIAQKAAEFLASSIVMSDHPMDPDSNMNPYMKHMMRRHTIAQAALANVITSSHPEVREIAASALASLSNVEALNKIKEGVQEGLFSEIEAVNYMGLADTDVSGVHLEEFLENGSTEARASAAAYLGSTAKYQSYIRDAVLLNPELDPVIRSAAAKSLSIYDSDYPSYALIVTLDPNLPSALYTEVVEGYLNNLQANNVLNPAIALMIQTSLENYSTLNSEVDVEELQSRLDQYIE